MLTVSATAGRLSVRVEGDESWTGEFVLPNNATVLAPGSHDGLGRYPFQTAGAGALSWSGEGRGCNVVLGSLQIRSVRYEAGVLRAIDMSFQHFCEGGSAALRGDVRWDADTAAAPFVPASAPPSAQWSSPAGTFAPTGTAIYLASERGDYIGDGYTWWAGAASDGNTLPGGPPGGSPGESSGQVEVSVSSTAGLLRVEVSGYVSWRGEFQAPRGEARLQPGYYGIVQRYPFHNPARGGLNWTMDSRGCNRLKGWFIIDSISYQGDAIEAVELRFTQYCDDAIAPLRGHFRWTPRGSTTLSAVPSSSLR